MKTFTRMAGASALALVALSVPALAQTTLTGIQSANDRIDDIERDVNKDLARANDDMRFGNQEMRQGLSGSASLGYSGKTGNNESQEFNAGARLRYGTGQFVQTLSFAADYADDAGTKTKEDLLGVYDANYYFNDQLYGFVLGRVESDGLASTADDTKTDAFIGFGPGIRLINSDQMAWRVQAGVGVGYLEDGLGNSNTETTGIASSRFFYKFNENVFATMDTDILKSESALRVNNDLGVNFKMTDAFSTRVSYLTEYNDSRAIRADNKLGVSLVYGF
jgi:putative salt-induced outer membrane protein